MDNKRITVLTPSHDKHFDSGDVYFLVDKYFADEKVLVTHEQVINYLMEMENGPRPYSCNHSFDCCGCVHTDYPSVVALDNITMQWIVRQSWYRNV